MRRIGLFLRRAATLVLALAALLLAALAAGVLLPAAGTASVPSSGATRTVFVVANPIHTDIVVPATPDLLARFGFLAGGGLPLDHPNLRTLAFGWGGRTFYTETPTWGDLTARAVWKSATWDRSVLHVALGGELEGGDANIRALQLPEVGYEALIGFIEASFERDAAGAPPRALPGAGYGSFDRFYAANGGFNLMLGCNTWTAAALRAAGVGTGAWSPLPKTLFWGLDLHAAR